MQQELRTRKAWLVASMKETRKRAKKVAQELEGYSGPEGKALRNLANDVLMALDGLT
jgi:hypothetical protein